MLRSVVLGLVLIVTIVMLAGCGGEQPAATGASSSSATGEASGQVDLERGKTMFFQCRACHSLDADGPHKVGPNLYGVFNRKAGLAEGFAYSDVMTNADVTWTEQNMTDWLARPSQFMPGNRMVFVGIKDADDRANLIAFLLQETTQD